MPKGPPYVIDTYYVAGSPIIDGVLTDPVWMQPNVTVTNTTDILNDWNLTIYTFVDFYFLYIGVEVVGDIAENPNDFVEVCFDVYHNNSGSPKGDDLKLGAENTGPLEEYYLFNGSSAGWIPYSDNTGTPNPWPSGYMAMARFTDWNNTGDDNMSYEFQIPISAAWGQPYPPDGNISGFCVHGFGQAAGKHVWWPDNTGSGQTPAIEYCNNATNYGNLVFHGSDNVPDHLEYVAGDDQVGAVGSDLAQPFQVRVLNESGGIVPSVPVNFTITGVPLTATGQYFVESGQPWCIAYSDVLGVANATLHLGSRPGDYQVNASNSWLAGNNGTTYINTLNATAVIGPLASIDVVAVPDVVDAGGGSTLTVWANDSQGNGISGLTIILDLDQANSNPGAIVSTPAAHVVNGTYTATYTAGSTGSVIDIVNASSGGIFGTANISVNATPVTLASLEMSANLTTVQVAGTLNLTIWANDTGGGSMTGLTINLGLDANPSAPGVGVTTPATEVGAGVYYAIYTAGQTAGVTDTVNATNGGLNATLDIVVVPGPPVDLAYVSGNGQSQNVSTVLDEMFLVRAVDQFGNNVSGVQVNWTLDGSPTGASGQAITPATNNTNTSGIAGARMTLGNAAGYYYANATSPSISGDSVALSAEALPVASLTYPEMVVGLASNVTKVVAGQSFTYILNYANTGTEAAADVNITLNLSATEAYVSDTSGTSPVLYGSGHSWHFTSVPVGSHTFSVVCSVPSDTVATSITNHFTLDYDDQNGQAMPRIASNTVTISILSEAVVNVPPIIDGVPDLIVHYDWDYSIDLSPYITDPDSPPTELFLLFSDNVNARVSPSHHLTMVLNYSQELVDTTLTLNITVSDGYGSDWDNIKVTVTEDFPPEVLQALPDVTLNEDTVRYAFNITEYFFDRDGDSLYYTLGEKMINVTILWNYTVRITPEENWYGSELITFRALDPTGALIEDSITITVLPVNDAPVLEAIPDQEGTVNIAWVVDLGDYVSDVDNDLDELTVTTDSSYVTVNGLNLTFRATDVVESDIVTVTISDGEDQTYGQVNVVVQPATAGSSIPVWIFPPIVILIVAALLFLLLAKRKKPVIEQAYLIFHDGTLICHVTSRMIPEMDSEIFSSMFMAIQDFVKDSFKDEKKWELKKLEFGDNKIFVERGQSGWTILALVYQEGTDSQLQNLACRTLNAVEKEYFDTLETWDGNLDKIRGTKDIVKKELSMK